MHIDSMKSSFFPGCTHMLSDGFAGLTATAAAFEERQGLGLGHGCGPRPHFGRPQVCATAPT